MPPFCPKTHGWLFSDDPRQPFVPKVCHSFQVILQAFFRRRTRGKPLSPAEPRLSRRVPTTDGFVPSSVMAKDAAGMPKRR